MINSQLLLGYGNRVYVDEKFEAHQMGHDLHDRRYRKRSTYYNLPVHHRY